MSEEKKIESEEDKVNNNEEMSEEDKKIEADKQEGFEKGETVPSSKYNQSLRKQREIEAKNRDLERQLAEAKGQKETTGEDEEDEEDDKTPDPSKLLDEKLKPVIDSLKKREENDKKLARTTFFEKHKEYLNAEKWQELLDEMDNSLNPNSNDDYYTQLEKAHRIISGDTSNADIENKVTELANDAGTGGDGAEKTIATDEFTAEDKAYMKEWNISEEGMRAFKKKQAQGLANVM